MGAYKRIQGDLGSWINVRVEENREQVAPTGGKEQPSKSVKKESWYKMAMQDAQEKETSRSMFRGSESSETGHTIMEGIASVSEGATNQVDWRAGMVADLVAKIEPTLGGRSTFLAKREC
jgi:hypothetical protein